MTRNPWNYPITIQFRNNSLIACQKELSIFRAASSLEEVQTKEDIGALVIEVLKEIHRQINSGKPLPLPPLQVHKVLPDEYVTVKKASEILGFSVSTVHRMCKAGNLKYKRTPGGNRRILLDDQELVRLRGLMN